MDTVREAPRRLASLFDDGGAAFLADAGLESWEAALHPVPVPVLGVSDGPDAGLRQLLALRDLWSAHGVLCPALAATRALVGLRTAALGSAHPDVVLEHAALGTLLQRAGQIALGGELLDRAWTTLRSVAGGHDLRVAVVAQNVAALRMKQGEVGEAEHALEIAYRIRTARAPDTTGLVAAQLGEIRAGLGRPADALPLLREAWEKTARTEGPTATRTLARAQMLGTVLNQLGRYPEAIAALRPVYDAFGADADPERRAAVAFELGLALDRTGTREEGLRRIEEALRITRQLEIGGQPHATLSNRVTMMAQLHAERGRTEVAEGLLREAMEADRRLFGDASAEVAGRYAALGQFCVRFGRVEEAVGWLDAACSLLRSTVGDTDPATVAVADQTAAVLTALARTALEARDRELAGDLLLRAHELAQPVLGFGHEKTRRIRELLDRNPPTRR